MTGHDELQGFARDAAGVLDARGAGVRPDFAAMMARVAAISQEEDPLARVGPRDEEEETDEGAGLGAFTGALRAELDAKVLERSLVGIPPQRGVQGKRRGAVIGVAMAMAAALVLFVIGSGIALRERGGGPASAAGNTAVPGAPVQAPQLPVVVEQPAVLEDMSDVPEDMSKRDLPAEVVAPPEVKAGRSKRRGGEEKAAPGPSLEDEAQALWQRGELAAAEAKYRAVLRAAGATRRAELAYGDLFALVRQMHGADGQAKVWREYLSRFPDGRFADDARAGLCQRTAKAEAAACWREYLTRHPGGGHREQAEAALGDER